MMLKASTQASLRPSCTVKSLPPSSRRAQRMRPVKAAADPSFENIKQEVPQEASGSGGGGCGSGGGGCSSCGGSADTKSSQPLGGTAAGAMAGAMEGFASISREDIQDAFALKASAESEKVLSISELLASCPEDGVWEDDPADSWMRS